MKRSKILMVAAGSALCAVTVTANATNGYFSHGYGTKNKGMAGAGVALSQDALAAATNPAGMAGLGERFDIGLAVFNPNREYSVDGFPSGQPGTFPLETGGAESDSDYFLIPHFGYNWDLGDGMAVGISIYGNGGMNTDYPAHANPIRGSQGQGADPNAAGFNPCVAGVFKGTGVFCDGTAGVNLSQLFIAPTFAQSINKQFSWGITPILAYQEFEAKGLGTFAGFVADGNPDNLSNRGKDDSTGFGGRVGVLFNATDQFRIGAAYQTEIDMSEFDKYSDLFAEQGDFDIPANWTLGIAWDTSPRSTLTFDVQQIMYGDIASIGNNFSQLTDVCFNGNPDGCLGGDEGAGFGWDDMTVYKLGYQWSYGSSADWVWRIGYSHGDQPIPKSEVLFNVLAPGVMEDHVTAGFTKAMGDGMELNFALMYAPNNSVKGSNPMDPGQEIEIEMTQYELELGFGWKF
jgi:long-chain fatty acid transport protein